MDSVTLPQVEALVRALEMGEGDVTLLVKCQKCLKWVKVLDMLQGKHPVCEVA